MFQEESLERKHNKVLVVLPRITYLNEINNLLDILGELNEEFIIRPHPTIYKFTLSKIRNKENFLLDTNLNILSSLSSYKYKACVGFNTSCLFEACIYKQNIIQFNSSNNEFIIDGIPIFTTKEDLKELLTKKNYLTGSQYESLNNEFFNI